MPSIFCPGGHFTINARFTAEEFANAGITLSSDADTADVIVAALAEELSPYINQYKSGKRYLIWCDEPLWSCMYQRFDASRTAVFLPATQSAGVQHLTVDAMNCFTGNVMFSNHHFLLDIYHLDPASCKAMQATAPATLPAASERKIAAFLTYRNDGRWNYEHTSGIFGLNTLRSRIAMEGRLLGKVDIFGRGWPLNLALADDADGVGDTGPFELKIQRYKNYKFALCFENTWAPYYVTEKIWHAVLAGCLPIYFAGPRHSIYQDFPRNSFIDYHDLKHPTELFELIDRMSQAEFDQRLAMCRTALQNAILISREGQATRRLQLAMFSERIFAIAAELAGA